ncbi:unnamed protein product [Caenorhabditis angaria]|uniref:ShKT domain-containing protein n=1 Tax=Caenorhabditis angaria TaxID=860376 RepID=A0A9P1J0U3_9PELO|nr:unnamed protein product [Caenorhabditis angaria]
MPRLLVFSIFLVSFFDTVYGEMSMQMVAFKATRTPCCIDTLMPAVCKSLYNRDHEKFTRQCRSNPDFSFVQCCHSCHFNADLFTASTIPVPADLYQHDVEEMLLRPNPSNCFDRHGINFCEAFVTKSGLWGRRSLSCQHSAFAFRVCRKTCGFCSAPNKTATVRYDSTLARTPKSCRP